jgi:elongator complex protein 2
MEVPTQNNGVTTKMSLSSTLELHGAAATSSPHSLIHLPSITNALSSSEDTDGSIIYASNCVLNIAQQIKDDDENENKSENKNGDNCDGDDDDQGILYNVNETLRTSTLPREKDCLGRSITTMALLKPINIKTDNNDKDSNQSSVNMNIIVCAYSDGTLTLWTQQNNYNNNEKDGHWQEDVVVGITGTKEGEKKYGPSSREEECFDSTTDVDGVYQVLPSMNIQTILITSSSKGVKCYKHTIQLKNTNEQQHEQQETTNYACTKIGTYPTSSMKITTSVENQLLLAVGTAMPRHNRIHFYTMSLLTANTNTNTNSFDIMKDECKWKHQGSLLGHLGWVTCLDWLDAGDHMMLASGSHDARIRLWKFHSPVVCDGDDSGNDDDDDDENLHQDNEIDDDEDADDIVEEGEARMHIYYKKNDGVMMQSAVTLEALLIGHEENVTALSWRPKSASPCLISSSMDRSILIWMEENEYTNGDSVAIEGVENVWAPVTRVGTAGGILGGSVGSSLLGFINVVWNESGDQIIGHGYGGSIYFWSRRQDKNGNSEMEKWRANPCITGHFRGCTDISWEVSEGLYLLSAGLDQTCRLWTYLPSSLPTKNRIWRELGRPQVHGYDLNTVACIGSGSSEMKHRFVSGADEKEARSFDAPIATLKLLSLLHGRNLQGDDEKNRIERAFIPSLGLSNRATADDAMEEDSFGTTGREQLTSDSYNMKSGAIPLNSLKTTIGFLPHERDLGVTSLWPEVRKLYGHQTELVCLVSNAGQTSDLDKKVFLASSCKARDADNAAIRIWDVERNMCLDVLKGGHKSTVIALSFSADGKILASSGKDRRLCLWKRRDTSEGTKFDLALMVESAHKRIVWSLHFCPTDPSLLCTGSRDGYIKLWRITDAVEENSQLSIKELHRWEPSSKTTKKVEPVTAVAFAPISLQSSAVLAVGLENGLLELWEVPLNRNDLKESCKLMHLIPTMYCHVDSVKKLAWKPIKEKQDDTSNGWDCTLASCSIDYGVRIFRLKQDR